MAFFKGLWYVYQMVITTNIYGIPSYIPKKPIESPSYIPLKQHFQVRKLWMSLPGRVLKSPLRCLSQPSWRQLCQRLILMPRCSQLHRCCVVSFRQNPFGVRCGSEEQRFKKGEMTWCEYLVTWFGTWEFYFSIYWELYIYILEHIAFTLW